MLSFKTITRFWTGSIRRQLILGIVLVHAVLMSIFVFDLVSRQARFLQRQTVQQATSLAKSLAANSRSWVLANDVVGLEEVVGAQANYPSLRYAFVHDNNGKILGHSERALVGKYIEDPSSRAVLEASSSELTLWDTAELSDVAVRIVAGERTLGWARIGLDRSGVASNLALITRDGIFYTLAAIVVGAVFALLMGMGLTKGIRRLIRLTESVVQGKRDVRSGSQRQDELGRLGRAFDTMLDTLDEATMETASSQASFEGLFENNDISIWNEDLSEIKSALDELRDQGVVDLSAYLSAHPELVGQLIGKCRVIRVNRATLKLFEVEDQRAFLENIDASFGANAFEVFTQQLHALWNGDAQFRMEADFVSYKGKAIVAIVSLRIPTSLEGFRSVPVSLYDVTNTRLLERQLQQSQRMEAVGQLTGGIAHDFNNLLAIMMGNAELLGRTANLDEFSQGSMTEIIEAIERASSLTARLLSFSRQQALTPVTVDICQVIRGVSEMLKRTLTERVELKVVKAADCWPVCVDAHQFENAIINLAINARDAMPEGGTLCIEAKNVSGEEIVASQIVGAVHGEFLRVRVSDSGVGMTQEVINKVFEPFFTTKEVGKGSGLGLSMVYGFTKQSSGYITITSELGKGASVNIYLPRSLDEVAPVEANTSSVIVGGSERILLVEDEEKVRLLASMVLRDSGYTVVEAVDGPEAITHLSEQGHTFDLLFTDVVLPGGLSGVDIANKAQLINAGIKVVYTTGYARDAVGKFQNSALVLNKPYREADLLQIIREALECHATSAEQTLA